MEIETRFPTIQAGPAAAVAEPVQQGPAGVPTGAGAESEFFISPVLRFDSRSLTVIFQVRDSRSGDVIRQFPPEAVVARYREDPSARPFSLPDRAAEVPGRDALQPTTPPRQTGTATDVAVRVAADTADRGPATDAVDLVA